MQLYRLFILSILLFSIIGCGAMAVTRKHSEIFEHSSYDKIWNASLLSINDIGFAVTNSDKSSGLIVAEGGRNPIIHNAPPRLNVFIIKQDGNFLVNCTAIQPGQLIDYGTSDENASNFIETLGNYLGYSKNGSQSDYNKNNSFLVDESNSEEDN